MKKIREIATKEIEIGMASLKRNNVTSRDQIADYNMLIDAIIVLSAEVIPERNLEGYKNNTEGLLESLALEICDSRGKYIQAVMEIATEIADEIVGRCEVCGMLVASLSEAGFFKCVTCKEFVCFHCASGGAELGISCAECKNES